MAAAPAENGATPSTANGSRTPRALADLHLNTILSPETATSSEDEGTDPTRIRRDEGRGVIGVSIGREQTRLLSPKTPAIEKQAAIDEAGGFFSNPDDAILGDTHEETELAEDEQGEPSPRLPFDGQHESPPTHRRTPERIPRPTQARKPSPWRSSGMLRSEKTRSTIREGLFGRKRSASGPSVLDGWQKAFMSSLPSFSSSPSNSSALEDSPRESSFGSRRRAESATSSRSRVGSDLERPSSRSGLSASFMSNLRRNESPREAEEQEAEVPELPSRSSRLGLEPIRNRPSQLSQLRRSTSDGSLNPRRALSRVSSLGDDSRFEHVSEQVNSRLKAIKDSFQDSNLRLPSISSFKPDFLRERTSDNTPVVTPPETPVDPMTRQPYNSTKAAFHDAAANKPVPHPYLHRAMSQLDGDLVILGGYRGSILRSAEPPHRQVWVPVKVGLNLRKVDLEVGLEEGDDEKAHETVIPGGMLSHIGPVDISRRLFKRLRACDNARDGKLRVHDWGYDWRLHPTFISEKLIAFLESLPCNQPGVPKDKRGAIVIAHSLGGLMVRYAVNKRPELFRGVVYAGVPKTCVNILGPLRNGDEVLLSSRVLTAQVNFSIRTSFALLPLDGRCFFDKHTKEEFRVDFFDPKTWLDHRLSPCVLPPLPALTTPPKPSGLTGYVNSMTSALPNFSPFARKASIPKLKSALDSAKQKTAAGVAEPDEKAMKPNHQTDVPETTHPEIHPDLLQTAPSSQSQSISSNPGTNVTISQDTAMAYLSRVLPTIKTFKQSLAHNATHASTNAYPPLAVIYGKSTPTVYGARIIGGRDAISRADAYDDLAFASGDGVVLARAAMLPEGYGAAKGGVVSSERGHVTLLGDLEAVGRCLCSVLAARRKGVGMGMKNSE